MACRKAPFCRRRFRRRRDAAVTMTFDALLTLGMVLEAMAVTGQSFAQFAQGLPELSMRKGEIAASGPNLSNNRRISEGDMPTDRRIAQMAFGSSGLTRGYMSEHRTRSRSCA